MIRFCGVSLILSVHIADFGTALILDSDSAKSTRYAGTLKYIAPEVKNVETTKTPYNPYAVDGTQFLEMLFVLQIFFSSVFIWKNNFSSFEWTSQ